MSIMKILYTTLIMLVCSLILVFEVLIEGGAMLLGKIADYMEKLYFMLLDKVKKEKPKAKANIDIPL